MANLESSINLDFKKFFRWWGSELEFLVPDSLKKIIENKQGQLIIYPNESSFEVDYQLGEKLERILTINRNEDGLAELKRLIEEDNRFDKADTILRLTGNDAIAKELTLPIATIDNLQQVITYELDRYTPFTAKQAYFSAKLIDKNKLSGQARVMLVLSSKEKVDPLLDEMKLAGITPVQVDFQEVANDSEYEEQKYNLLPLGLQQKKPLLPKLVHGSLIAAAVLLLLATLVLPVWWQAQVVDDLREQIRAIEKEARTVDDLQSQVDTLIAQTNEIIAKKKNSASLLELLNDLSKLIKDDTYLMHMQYSGDHFQINGNSNSASALISLLESSKLLKNARFVSPVVQDTRSGLERFQMSVDVNTGTQ